jgi:hypothetical protein
MRKVENIYFEKDGTPVFNLAANAATGDWLRAKRLADNNSALKFYIL